MTLPVLSRIAVVFGGSPLVRDLLFMHLAVEIPEERETTLAAPHLATFDFPDVVARTLRAYVASFPLAHVRGDSLVLRGAAARIAAAARALRQALERHVEVLGVVGSARLDRNHAATTCRVPLLIVERVDFASPTVTAAVTDRAVHGLPVVLTVPEEGTMPNALAAALRGRLQTVVIPATADA